MRLSTSITALFAVAFMSAAALTMCHAKPTKKETAAKPKVTVVAGCPAGMVYVQQKHGFGCKLNSADNTRCPDGMENVAQKTGHILGCKAK